MYIYINNRTYAYMYVDIHIYIHRTYIHTYIIQYALKPMFYRSPDAKVMGADSQHELAVHRDSLNELRE